jgi:hypothetical protein
MARKGKRIVQTCSLCEKTGHNKRRCSLDTVKIDNTSKSTIKISSKRQLPRVIKTETVSSIKKRVQKKKRAKNHYVPVVIGKHVSKSEHVVDLSEKQKRVDPSWDSIESFREKLAHTVDRRTVDFAASVREAKKTVKKKRKKIRTLHIPKISVPRIPTLRVNLPHIKFRLPGVSFPTLPNVSLPKLPVRRFAPAVFALLILVALPLPAFSAYRSIRAESAHIVSASTNAFVSLQESTTAAFQADTIGAQSALQDALAQFAEVEKFLEKDYRVLSDFFGALPFIGDHVNSRRAMVSAGQHIALGNTYVIKGVSDAGEEGDITMTDRLSILTAHIEQALPQYEEARRELVSVNTKILPEDKQVLFQEFLILYSTFIDDIQDLADLSHVLYDVFGGDAFRRYLVLFQNHHEIRPTGGFIGSFAVLDTQKGRIENIDIPGGGSYDIQGQLDKHIVPPLPLQLVNDRWELQDINWFFDFPTTARKAESFVEAARGTTFDGTIALNASVIERLLRVIGPVASDEYDVLLDADTVLPTLQNHVEEDYEKIEDEAPKEILSSVLDELLVAMQTIEPDQLILLLRELHEALGEKEIQIALKDKKSHSRIASFGWAGQIMASDPRQDYLAVVATNLQGQKSDKRIEQHIEHVAQVEADGSVVVRATISRTHTGDPYEDMYGAANITYMRLYVPEDAILLDAGGFIYPPEEAFKVPESWYEEDTDLLRIEHEVGIHRSTGTRITNEFGKTAFGNWMIVPPGESRDIWFTYRLPFSVVDVKREADGLSDIFASQPDAVSRYSLFVQKQSGVESTFASTIGYTTGWVPRWKSNDAVDLTPIGAQIETTLDRDTIYGVVLEYRP